MNLVNLNHETTIFAWIIVDFNFYSNDYLPIQCAWTKTFKGPDPDPLGFFDQYRRSHGLVFFFGKAMGFHVKVT